jgi:hypothetical protein
MVRVNVAFLILVVLFSLLACSQSPGPSTTAPTETFTPVISETETALASEVASPTPWVTGTETALAAASASPTPWVAGTGTALAVSAAMTQSQISLPTLPPSTTSSESTSKPTDFSPILYGGKFYQTSFFLLLGGVTRETWLAPDVSVARLSGEVTYSLHTLMQASKYFVWGKAPEFSPICKMYSVGTDAALDEAGFVGVVDSWEITKRTVTELSTDGQVYHQAVTDWLRTEGVPAPQVDSIHVYRVDIEGDGIDEVFIHATHLDESQHTTKAGDYSVILMRQVVGNEAVTKLVVGDIYRSQDLEITYPRTYTLANFIDLNQDGVLEVVVDIQKWEGFGARIFQIDGQDVIQTLSAEC